MATVEDMATWEIDDGTVENRCYFCSGQYYADKDESHNNRVNWDWFSAGAPNQPITRALGIYALS
jgi:hypothetical protein